MTGGNRWKQKRAARASHTKNQPNTCLASHCGIEFNIATIGASSITPACTPIARSESYVAARNRFNPHQSALRAYCDVAPSGPGTNIGCHAIRRLNHHIPIGAASRNGDVAGVVQVSTATGAVGQSRIGDLGQQWHGTGTDASLGVGNERIGCDHGGTGAADDGACTALACR